MILPLLLLAKIISIYKTFAQEAIEIPPNCGNVTITAASEGLCLLAHPSRPKAF
jgi:hypothetical protein